ncbi:MAG: hypothetical protein CM15mP111_4200 [Hyphomicrobiales bacterium]|nr:MAG: hypothetical protein CM15mP111_4200 [Hyphomicrobiales bacterium]
MGWHSVVSTLCVARYWETSLVTAKRALDAGLRALVLTGDSPVYKIVKLTYGMVGKIPPNKINSHRFRCHPPSKMAFLGKLAENYIPQRGDYLHFQISHIPDEKKVMQKVTYLPRRVGF